MITKAEERLRLIERRLDYLQHKSEKMVVALATLDQLKSRGYAAAYTSELRENFDRLLKTLKKMKGKIRHE